MCARSRSDACLLQVVKRVYHSNYACYGVRKVWHELQWQGTRIGRDQVARLMRSAGLRGATRQRRVRTTIPAPAATPAPDLVRRRWSRDAPDVVWVTDFERHEALQDRAVMKGHRRQFVAAD